MMRVFGILIFLAALNSDAWPQEQDVAAAGARPDSGHAAFPVRGSISLAVNDYCCGVGFDGTNLWVSAGEQATGVCEFYIFDEYGNQLENLPQGGGASGWGHRDLCWDGARMYGSFSRTINTFGPDYLLADHVVGCIDPHRALAYDGTYFYTGGFGEELTRMAIGDSTVTCEPLGAWEETYGLAYDEIDDVLYMSTANHSGDLHVLNTKGVLLQTYTTLPDYDVHGGCTMIATAQFGYVLCVLVQSSPDRLVFYDVGHSAATNAGSWGSIKALFR